jgi:hypothetical protein
MKIFRAMQLFAFLSLVFLLSGCVGGDTANKRTSNRAQNSNANASPAKDDVEEFTKLVNLFVTPEEVVWRETETQNGKKLIAVLNYSPQDAQTIVAQAEKYRPALSGELDAEDWFPPELIAKSQESGDEILKGKNYGANDFFSESYKNGKITRIEGTDYFVLELSNQ